jgi:protein O-GlcNAc transferase
MGVVSQTFQTRFQELLACGDASGARSLSEELLLKNPSAPIALSALGISYVFESDFDRATAFLRRAIRADSSNSAHWGNLGSAHLLSGDTKSAVRCLTRARILSGGEDSFANEYSLACKRRSAELYREGKWIAAAAILRRFLRAVPQDAEAWSDLGTLYSGLGRIRAGSECFSKAVKIEPYSCAFKSNLAVSLNYRQDLRPAHVSDAHVALFATLGSPAKNHTNDPDPLRRLRIGYYSADCCFSPTAFFLPSLLRYHDHSAFEVHCYSNTKSADENTKNMRLLADHWREVQHLDDNELYELICKDGIDILIDRTGHFGGGRPALFARSPAAVQASLPGYPATTGVPGIGYRFTDNYADPPEVTDHLHSERLVRLAHCFACYAPPSKAPKVTPLPALRNHFVTFGCFQKRDKITPGMLELWARILLAVPNSRLVFHHLFGGIKDVSAEFRVPIERIFNRAGVDPKRLEWVGSQPHYQHLESIAQADIALDTFPYNGMTTTCECLWMGVPVVTWSGKTHCSRVGLSYLTNVGLSPWVASTANEYIAIAVTNAGALSKLRRIRSGLRQMMLDSPLTDAPAYTRAVEDAYRALWRSWCDCRARTQKELGDSFSPFESLW